MDGLDDIVEEFLVESHENLDQLDADLVALEQEPNSRERLSSIFRTIHTIKGTSGFLAFNRLEEVTHVGENMLSRLRDGELDLTPTRTSVLLQMVDIVRSLLTSVFEDVLELGRREPGEGGGLLAQPEEELRDVVRLPQALSPEVVVPAVGHRAPLPREAVELELLQRQLAHPLEQRSLLVRRDQLGAIAEALGEGGLARGGAEETELVGCHASPYTRIACNDQRPALALAASSW